MALLSAALLTGTVAMAIGTGWSRWAVAAHAIVGLALNTAGGILSRQIEASADAFALRETHDPRAFIALERRLVRSNVADPDPPAVWQALFGTHPAPIDRIGMAVAYERQLAGR